ncbi:hypothetical protein R50073_50260 (plasmid) [Maricurvus nonylphenolicus]|uniref:phosphoadenosine phosphosulfate reductase domain-containing protein n=1 Tax=Maricurvus nonylphenolicus TaxID=1008307 RepID=UPI0036F3998E
MHENQIALFDLDDEPEELPDLDSYSVIIIACSGGKDSIACLLHLLDSGADPKRIELWHHCVDGERNGEYFMDWPVTEDYCKKLAEAFGISIYFSWKIGGFRSEMLRDNELTKPCQFETPEQGVIQSGGVSGKPNTRKVFPQVAASLSVRWCSSYLKIDVSQKAITNQLRFCNSKTLFVTGERAQESSARANYKVFEPHKADNRNGKSKRHVDAYRPVHGWDESQVWEIIERYKVNPHPAYRAGWGRLSCISCIFGNADQWASVRRVSPKQFDEIAYYESQFGKTIHRKYSVTELADKGTPYAAITEELIALGMAETFNEPIILDQWSLPAGAFGDSSTGPS